MLKTVGLFRRKPTQAEAMQFLSSNAEEVAEWCKGTVFTSTGNNILIDIPVEGGLVQAKFGDWIVKESNKPIYVLSDNDFYFSFEGIGFHGES